MRTRPQRVANRSSSTAKLRRRRARAHNCFIDSTLNAKGVESRTLAGREYLVAPITLIVPGVLNGSQGPGLYTKEENGKNLRAWNHMPLLIGHPTAKEGSGRNIDVLSKRYVGFVADVKNGKNLEGMAWFDVQAMNSVPRGKEVLNLLRNKRPLEISTGLDVQKGKGKGIDNSGAEYEWKAENYQPDHVAILLDEKGACSNDDGCGINNGADMTDNNCGIDEDGFSEGNDCAKGGSGGGSKGGSSAKGQKAIKDLIDGHRSKYKSPAEAVEKSVLLSEKIVRAFRSGSVTEADLREFGGDDFADTVLEDAKDTSYNQSNLTTNSEEEVMALNKAQRKTLIDNIVKNGCDCYTEDDRESLENYSDERLQAIDNHLKTHTENAAFVANAAGKKGVKNDLGKVAKRRMLNEMSDDELDAEMKKRFEKNKKAKNADPEEEEEIDEEEEEEEEMANRKKGAKNSRQSADAYLKNAPPEIRKVLNRAMNAEKKQRQKLIDTLVENKSEEQQEALAKIYNRMETDELELLVQNMEDEECDEDDEDCDDEHQWKSSKNRRSVKNRDRYEDQDDYSDYSARGVARTQNAQPVNRIVGGSLPQYEDLFPVINGHKTGGKQSSDDEE